jgi:hypothetical protein
MEWQNALGNARRTNVALGVVDPESLALLTDRDPQALARLGWWAEGTLAVGTLLTVTATLPLWLPGLLQYCLWLGQALLRELPLLGCLAAAACVRALLPQVLTWGFLCSVIVVQHLFGMYSVWVGLAGCLLRGLAGLWVLPLVAALGLVVAVGNTFCCHSRRGAGARTGQGLLTAALAGVAWGACWCVLTHTSSCPLLYLASACTLYHVHCLRPGRETEHLPFPHARPSPRPPPFLRDPL